MVAKACASSEWHVAVKTTREKLRQGLVDKHNKACEDLYRQEASLQRTLRVAVVGDVMKLFRESSARPFEYSKLR
jgi:hypothetical protein